MNFVVNVPTVGGQSQYSYYCTVTENSYDISTNKSNVTIAFSIKGVSAKYSDWTTYYGIIVDNEIKTNGNKKMTVDGNKYYRVTEWTGNIDHNNNGSKTINVGIFLYHNGPENYMPKQYTSDSPLQIGSVQLTTIPRKSEISHAGDTTIGSKCNIKWTPASEDFKYKIEFSLGTWNHTTGYIEPGSTSLYTYIGYTIPSDDTILLNNLTRDSGTMKAVLRTYNEENALIGTSSEKSFTVQISGNLAPTVGTITLTPQTYEYLLQGKNKLQIDASGWSASTGSTITSYTFSGDGITTTTTTNSCITVGPISKTGELTFTVKATDTRNQYSTSTANITCYAYKAPTFTSFNVSNIVKDDNGNATINCSYTITYYSVNSTNGINTFTINGAGAGTSITYGNWTISEPNISGVITASGSSVIGLGTSVASSYNIYATVSDIYGGSRNSKTESVYGEDRVFNIYPDGTGVAIGKMADHPNLFDCRWSAKFNDSIEFGSGTQGKLYSTTNTQGRNIAYLLNGDTTSNGTNAGIGIAHNTVFATDTDVVSLGYKDRLWNQLWAANSTIQTSDRNKKKDIVDMSDVQEQLFNQLRPVTYKMISGTSDRTHYGFISQDVEDALINVGLDGKDFAGFCKDVCKDDSGKTILDSNGNVINDYSLRYSEFIALNTYMIQKLQERILELENTIKELKKT